MKKFSYILIIVLLVAVLALIGACDRQVTVKFVSEGTTIATVQAKAGEDISDRLPAEPERDGYIFEGWYLDPDGNGSKQNLPTVMPDSDVTYYAKWREGNLIELTLSTNDGGTLAQTSYKVEKGSILSEFLADKAPVPKTGLTFAGWYVGSTPLPETMTADYDIALIAKFNATYTLAVHKMDTDGNYTQTDTVTDTAFYGERFNCGTLVSVPEHFELNTLAEGSRLSTDSLGVNEHFDAYLMRDRYYVMYYSGLPSDVDSTGGGMVYYYYGATVGVEEGIVVPAQPYRLLGWATEQNGGIWKPTGETFVIDSNLTLYGVWEKGYADMFGGSDQLYPATDDPTNLRLRRTDSPDRFGTYDPATGLFEFRDEQGELVLNGCIRGNYFYYYRDVLEKSYPDMDGSDDAIAIGADGKTVYTHDGETINGYYTVEPDTLYFQFVSDDGEIQFLFNLFESTSDGSVVYRRQNLDEAGVYALPDNHVIELDGLGGLTYRYNSKNYKYQIGGVPVLEVYGYYEWQEENGFYLAYTRDATNILFELVFYIDKDSPIPELEGFDDVTQFDGVIRRDDGTRGSYSDKWETVDDGLYLDGFGEGKFGEIEGKYTLINWLYVYEDDNGDVIADYWLVRFESDDGTIYYFRLDIDYGDFESDRVITSNQVKNDYDIGRYDFDRIYVMGTWFQGFLYIFENGEAEMWSYYGDTVTDEPTYVLYSEFVSSVTKLANGTYTFNSMMDESTGELYDSAFNFRLSDGKLTEVYPEVHDIVTVAEGLLLDRTEGKATYNGQQIRYGYVLGYVDLYEFIIDDQTTLLFIYADGSFTEITDCQTLDIRYVGGAEENDYAARLLFVGSKVYFGLLMSSGQYRYIGEGTSTAVEGEQDVFRFVLGKRLDEFSGAELADYNDFRYKQNSDEGYFVQREENPYDLTNFVSDGYGNITYTDGNGNSILGTVQGTMGNLVYFVDTNKKAYVFSLHDDRVVDVTSTGDAGFWYQLNDNMYVGLYMYLVFDGEGNVTLYEFDTMTGEAYDPQTAQYSRTENWRDDYLEYRLSRTLVTDAGSVEISSVLLGFTLDENNTPIPVFQRQIPHRVGDFDVVGGGHITSAGYPTVEATYTDAYGVRYNGNMYIGNINMNSEYSHGFTSNVEGTCVQFWVYSNGLATSTYFYFDISDGKLVQRTTPYGKYLYYDGTKADSMRYLSLDGRGTLTVHNGYNILGTCEYSYIAESDAYTYTLDGATVVFRLGYMTENDRTVYVYTVYDQNQDRSFDGSDWSRLTVDGFGNATYVGRFGNVYNGYVDFFADGLGYFGAVGISFVFAYDGSSFQVIEHGAYVATYYADDFTSFVLSEALLTVDGVNYYYTVEGDTVTAYPVAGGNSTTFTLPTSTEYNLGNKTYYRYNGGAITFTDDEFGDDALTLSFVPQGATFGVKATLNGNSTDFTVEVSYDAYGAITVLLVYYTGEMDTVAEYYNVRLHYSGTVNAFEIEPLGYYGTYADSSNSKYGVQIDGRRIGPFIVGDDTVTFNIGYVTDSAKQPLVATISYSAVSTGNEESDYNLGNNLKAVIQGSDGDLYTLLFFLNEEDKQFVLRAVTVENTFEVNIGNVTVAQLWYSAGLYSDHSQYDIVNVSVPETGVTTTIFHSTIDDGAKTILVRRDLNTTNGNYTYNAYVFNVTYGEDKTVNGLTVDGNYLYAEANQGGAYTVRFLYTNVNGVFTVKYLLTFTIGTDMQDATFTQRGLNSYTVSVTGGGTYTVNIRRNGTQFVLTVQAE